jgi:hypothetical protein
MIATNSPAITSLPAIDHRGPFQGTVRNIKQEQQVMGLTFLPALPRPPAGPPASDGLSLHRSSLDSNHSKPNLFAQMLRIFLARFLCLFLRFEWLLTTA